MFVGVPVVFVGVPVAWTGSGDAVAVGVTLALEVGKVGGADGVGASWVLVVVGSTGAAVGAGFREVGAGALVVGVAAVVAGGTGGVVTVGLLLGVAPGVVVAVGEAVGVAVVVWVDWGGLGLGMRGGAAVRVGVGTAVGVARGGEVDAGTRGTRSWPMAVNSPGTVPPLLPSSCAPGVCRSRIFAAHGSDGEVTSAVPLTVTGPRSRAAGDTTIGAG